MKGRTDEYIEQYRHVVSNIVEIQKQFKRLRESRKITQKMVAKALHWKQSEVSRFENSEVMPRFDTVLMYATFLGIDLSFIPDTELAWDPAKDFSSVVCHADFMLLDAMKNDTYTAAENWNSIAHMPNNKMRFRGIPNA